MVYGVGCTGILYMNRLQSSQFLQLANQAIHVLDLAATLARRGF